LQDSSLDPRDLGAFALWLVGCMRMGKGR